MAIAGCLWQLLTTSLWKLSEETGVKFVWEPIGGLKQFPLKYAEGGGLKMRAFFVGEEYDKCVAVGTFYQGEEGGECGFGCGGGFEQLGEVV